MDDAKEILMLTNDGLANLQKREFEAYTRPSFPSDNEPTFAYPGKTLTGNYPDLSDPSVYSKNDVWQADFQNSKTIGAFFDSNELPLSLLFDERYMAYLTHYVYFPYMKKRWPLKEGKAWEKRRNSRYCFDRAPSARHGILSLYWPRYLINQGENDLNRQDAKLKCYFENRNCLDRLLERTYSRNVAIFNDVLDAILSLPNPKLISSNGRSHLLGKLINNTLSVVSLDAMAPEKRKLVIAQTVKAVAEGNYDACADRNKEEVDDESNQDD